MRRETQRSMSRFLLLVLPILPELKCVFFTLFLGMYLTTVLGNLLIILLIRLDSHLHMPMYFFLSHPVAFIDVSFSSVTIPKMFRDMLSKDKFIPYAGCIIRMYFFIVFGSPNSLLLAVIAYDRYVAIHHPLCNTTIIRNRLCVLLVAASCLVSCGSALLHTLLLAPLSFCGDNIIPHFFCSLTTLLKLSCSDTSVNERVIFTVLALVLIFPFSTIHSPMAVWGLCPEIPLYHRAPQSLVHMWLPPLCGVSLLWNHYSTILFSSLSDSKDKIMIASMMYTAVTPMLNPFIYSLRNRDIKLALAILFRNHVLVTTENHLIMFLFHPLALA